MRARELTVAIAGFGKMGMLHAAVLQSLPDVRVCAVVEPQLVLRAFAPRLVPGVRFYGDLERALERERPDAVYVTTPTASHPALCEATLASGTSLFVEKPLAATPADAERTATLAAGRPDLTTMVGYVKRYTPTYQLARRRLLDGAVGTLLSFNAGVWVDQVRSSGRGWRFRGGRSGGGVLSVLGCHLVDVIRWLFGELEPSSGRAVHIYSTDVEDEFSASVRTQAGVEGSIDVSWSRPGYRIPETLIDIQGSTGRMRVTDDYVRIEDSAGEIDIKYKQHLTGGVRIDVGGPEFTFENEAFVDALRRGDEAECSIAEGYRTQVTIDRLHAVSNVEERRPVA